jgi:hypothetical protein
LQSWGQNIKNLLFPNNNNWLKQMVLQGYSRAEQGAENITGKNGDNPGSNLVVFPSLVPKWVGIYFFI